MVMQVSVKSYIGDLRWWLRQRPKITDPARFVDWLRRRPKIIRR